MEGEGCLSIRVSNEDAYKEKTRIAEVAAATMCRLNSIMKQMRDWRDDRMKLRSNIWRLKLALRVAGRETDDTLRADPLIGHQKSEIKRLETINENLKKELNDIKTALLEGGNATQEIPWKFDDKLVVVKQEYLMEREQLNNEIQYLKSRLNEAEEGHEHSSEVEHLKCKLKHFMMVDHTMEIIFTDIVNKVAETIANLSEELVNSNEQLHKSRLRNDNLYMEIDKMKAMLRYKNGNLADYKMRIAELDNLTKRLKAELNRLKVDYNGNSWDTNPNLQNNLKNVEQLANNLRNKLKNDHEALLAAGDLDCLKYMQKIFELRITLRHLHVDTTKFDDRYEKRLSILNSTLQEIDTEIDKLKSNHVKKHCRIGGDEGLEYWNKIKQLEDIVEKARAMANGLNQSRSNGNSNEWKDIEKIEGFVGKICYEIKQLEVIVATNDRSSMFKRIEQLEELVGLLKSEATDKNERVNVLEQKLNNVEGLLHQRTKELEDTRKNLTVLREENRTLKISAKEMEERTLELQREQEGSRMELDLLQQVKREASITGKRLQNLQADKEELLKEIGKIRETLATRDEEIKTVLVGKNTLEETLNEKIADLMKNVQDASKKNEKLQSKMDELQRTKCKKGGEASEKGNGNSRLSREASESMNAEIQRLKASLAMTEECLDNANHEITDLKAKLEYFSNDKTKLEANILQLESTKETLVYQLDSQKRSVEERLKELTKFKTDYNELDADMVKLNREKEQLITGLTNLKVENELLQQCVERLRVKNSTLENEIEKYKVERQRLCEENEKFKTTEENLTRKLKEVLTELNGSGDKISRLESENSKLRDDLHGSALKSVEFEARVQMFLSEKNELASRINELNEEKGALKDQLNEVKATNEYCSMEMTKFRKECDKTKTENIALQALLNEIRNNNERLTEASDQLKLKLNEIYSECRILKNQLKILELMNATLRKEKELLEQEYTSSLRSGITKAEKDDAVTYNELIVSEHNGQIVKYESGKVGKEKRNVKGGKRGSEKSRSETKEELKKLIVENESLRFEVLTLKGQLTRAKAELQRLKNEFTEKESEVTIEPVSNNLEIVNLYCKEVSHYNQDNVGTMTRTDQSSVYTFNGLLPEQDAGMEIERLLGFVNKLKVENVALKMEMNSLRCSLVVNFAEDEKRRNELRNAAEEIQALKAELTKLRDEKESLRDRLDTAGMKLDRLESEKAALKNELYTLRKINTDLKYKVNELQCNYQKLKSNTGFEDSVVKAIKKIKKYTLNAQNQDIPDDELRILVSKCVSREEMLHSAEHKVTVEWT